MHTCTHALTHTHTHTHTHTTPTAAGGAKDTLQAANFFAKAVHKDTAGVGNGALMLCWRLSYDTVGNVLKPTKPQVVLRQRITLIAGKPVRVAWPKDL